MAMISITAYEKKNKKKSSHLFLFQVPIKYLVIIIIPY